MASLLVRAARRRFGAVAGSAALCACSAHPLAPPVAALTEPAPAAALARAPAAAPRLFPPTDRSEATLAGIERDGSRRIIAFGLRLVERPSGAVEVADEYLPVARAVQSLELPERLGGGFLFYLVASSATLFFRSQTFTGPLEPFANLDLEAERVALGFDRLYVFGKRAGELAALDANSGQATGLGGLPRAPAYGQMAFADAWFGAVEVPFQGIVASFDAGLSWHPVPLAATELEAGDGALLLGTGDGEFSLDARGRLARRDVDSDDQADDGAPAPNLAEPHASGLAQLGARPLVTTVLRGFPAGDGSAVVASGGALFRVRLSDGQILASVPRAPSGGDCSAIELGSGHGLVCGGRERPTTIYEFVPPLGLRSLREFSGPRFVAAGGNGALVIRGGCAEEGPARAGSYCIRSRLGQFNEMSVVETDGAERVVALADGSALVLVPPAAGAPGFLERWESGHALHRVALELPSEPPETAVLLRKGLWLDGFVQGEGEQLLGWVAGASPLVGVRVGFDGHVRAGPVQGGVERALLSGPRALLVGRGGPASETVDGGLHWSDVDLPPEFEMGRDWRAQGCSELGCVFGGFVRVGWRGELPSPKLESAPLPEHTRLPSPGGSRLTLSCTPSGDKSPPTRPVPPPPGRVIAGSDEATPAPWAPFGELAAPTRGPGELGFDTAADNDPAGLHAYVWGKRGADWWRAGSFQIRAVDRFSVDSGLWSTAVTRSAWPDELSASEAFGFDGSGSPTLWRVVPEPGGRAAALLVSARGVIDLFLAEEGRPIGHVSNVARLGLAQLSSVVKLGSVWYASAYGEAHSLMLFRIEGSDVRRLAEYRDIVPGRGLTVGLAKGVRGDALALWVRATSYYVYPVDPRSGQALTPLEVGPRELATLPRTCDPGEDGYLLSGALPLDPYVDFGGPMSARGFEARLLASARGVCIEALSAEADLVQPAPANHAVRGSAGVPVPLTVTERRPGGRRWGFDCVQGV